MIHAYDYCTLHTVRVRRLQIIAVGLRALAKTARKRKLKAVL